MISWYVLATLALCEYEKECVRACIYIYIYMYVSFLFCQVLGWIRLNSNALFSRQFLLPFLQGEVRLGHASLVPSERWHRLCPRVGRGERVTGDLKLKITFG
jgi:hypothetical protein